MFFIYARLTHLLVDPQIYPAVSQRILPDVYAFIMVCDRFPCTKHGFVCDIAYTNEWWVIVLK